MAAYGKGQMLGSGINPESFKQDYSGFSRAAEMQAQGLSNLGGSIAGAIKDFGETKKEQKKVDAYNKASAKAIEAAITLGDSYGITGAEQTLRPFLSAYNDPNLSPIEKAAMLDEGKAMIPNVFGRFDQSESLAIEKTRLDASQRSSTDPKMVEFAVPGGTQQGLLQDGVIKPLQVSGFDTPQQGASSLQGLPEPLQPYASEFTKAGAKHGVPPALLAAIAMHETGGGTSSAFRNKNNAMGVSDSSGPVQMESVAASIEKMASLLGRGINQGTGPYANAKTIDDIARVYAPPGAGNDPRNLNQFWTQGVTSNIQKLSENKAEQVKTTTQNQGGIGFTPAKKPEVAETFRAATPEEAAEYGAVAGQINEQTKRFYPISLPTGMTVESDGQGGIKVVQGAGVGGKDEKAAAERKKQQSSFVDEFTKTAAETIKLLPNLPDNPVGAKFGAVLGEMLPGTEQGRVVSRLNTIKANLALDKINQMRAASPTGGAAGTMTVQEWPLFMQEFGSLDAAENKQDLEARLKNASVKLFNRVNGTPEERQSALEKGTITKEQNEIVQKQYDGMLSTLGLAPVKSAVAPSSNSQSIYEKHGVK